VSAAQVHATAIVHPGAQLAPGVSIGAYSIVGEHVVLGAGTWVGPHVVIEGHTRLGRNNRVYQFASIGAPPQDKKYAGEPTVVEIGDGNTMREGVTINRGTAEDAGITRIGDDNWLMGYVHVAHDCEIGNKIIMANYTGLAGHVRVGDWAILGGATVVHQFVNIGAHSFTSMGTYLAQDLPPYVMAAGNMAKPFGINSEGLRRRGFSADAIAGIKQAYRTLYRSGLGLEEARRQLAALAASCVEVGALLEFLERSKRGVIR
jgi:UDP-N-acetylglucosamine acyltransferase